MTTAPNLTDTQLILLNTASQRPGGSLFPFPASITLVGAAAQKSISVLMAKALVSEAPVERGEQVWREQDGYRFGLIITEKGRQAISVRAEDLQDQEGPARFRAANGAPHSALGGKQQLLLGLLKRNGGASIPEIVAATSWLPHSSRAALTGLRKNGVEIRKSNVNGITRYVVVEPGA